MNLRAKLLIGKIGIACIILFLLIFPWNDLKIMFPTAILAGKIVIDFKYIVAGCFFSLAAILSFVEKIFLKKEYSSKENQMLEVISDKMLIEGTLILLSYYGFIRVIVPILLLILSTCREELKFLEAKERVSQLEKIAKVLLYLGIAFLLFYNLPFEIWGVYVAETFIYVATLLSLLAFVMEKHSWKRMRD